MVSTLGKNNLDDELYDESLGYDDETGVKIANDLTDYERQQAIMLYRLFNELWGLCIIKGEPGTGKDTFANYITWKLKRYFPWKRTLRDYRPRKLYGTYTGLFNEAAIADSISNMKLIAKGKTGNDDDGDKELKYGERLEKAADDWIKGGGEVLLKNSIVYIQELWDWCYNREPHKPINKTMGAINKMKRHLDALIFGCVQLVTDLDKKTCLPFVDWSVTCTRSATNKTGFVYYVQKVKYDRRINDLTPIGQPFPIAFDAGKPRPELEIQAGIGDGGIKLKKLKYLPETEDERVVLEVLKAGYTQYDEIVDIIESAGDMSEREILDTLKDLKFTRRKRVIDYPCYFGLFNSKSAADIRTTVKKVQD